MESILVNVRVRCEGKRAGKSRVQVAAEGQRDNAAAGPRDADLHVFDLMLTMNCCLL